MTFFGQDFWENQVPHIVPDSNPKQFPSFWSIQ